MPGPGAVEALLLELVESRQRFLEALGDVDPALITTPGLVGDWSARELVAHLGYWLGHAVEAIHHVEDGRAAEFEAPSLDEVQARNDTVARVARETDMETVRRREEAIFDTLVERLQRMDAVLLEARLADWGPLEAAIREDGPEHYREHTADVRAWWSGAEADADEGDEEIVAEEPDNER